MTGDLKDAPRCVAMAKGSGERCKRRPIPGGRVCVMHGGAAPAVRAAADRRRAEAQATAVFELVWDRDAEPITNPVESLLRLAGRMEHTVDVVGARIESAGLDSAEAVVFTKLLRELRIALEGLERLNLAARHVELEQGRADLVVGALQAVLVELNLAGSDRQRALRVFLAGIGRPVSEDQPVILQGELS